MSVDIVVDRDCPAEAVCALYKAAGWWEGEDILVIPRMIAGSFRFASAWYGDKLIGMGRVLSDGVSDAYIQDVTVLPLWRNKGIGSRIVSLLVEECERAGISWVALVAEPGTAVMYERLGFSVLAGYLPMRRRNVKNA